DEALRSYTAGNVTGTEDAAKRLGFLNLIEAHKAPFARGDARVLAGDYDGARAAFEESLVLAAQNAGHADQAKQYFDRVQQVVNEAPPSCFEGDAQNEEGQQLRDAQQRAQDQNQQQQNQQNQQNQQQDQPSEDKQQQLDEKAQENLQQRQQGDEQHGAVT